MEHPISGKLLTGGKRHGVRLATRPRKFSLAAQLLLKSRKALSLQLSYALPRQTKTLTNHSLLDALDLSVLVARIDPRRHSRRVGRGGTQ
jgi:hypothetical protein